MQHEFVVYDDPTVTEVVTGYLERAGYAVEVLSGLTSSSTTYPVRYPSGKVRRAFDLLAHLLRHQDRAFSRPELLQTVSG